MSLDPQSLAVAVAFEGALHAGATYPILVSEEPCSFVRALCATLPAIRCHRRPAVLALLLVAAVVSPVLAASVSDPHTLPARSLPGHLPRCSSSSVAALLPFVLQFQSGFRLVCAQVEYLVVVEFRPPMVPAATVPRSFAAEASPAAVASPDPAASPEPAVAATHYLPQTLSSVLILLENSAALLAVLPARSVSLAASQISSFSSRLVVSILSPVSTIPYTARK